MNQLTHLLLIIVLAVVLFFEPPARAETTESDPDLIHPMRLSRPVIVGVLSIMFFLMFIILAYTKFCHRPLRYSVNPNTIIGHGLSSRFSGIDKRAIQSLPFFQFSSLKGSKQGLECSVCLSKFEDSETLRLLPHCNHAFHMNCIDRWLEGHSSCPLCRHKFGSNDFLNFSSRFSRQNHPSNLSSEDVPNLELFVRREEDRDRRGGSSRSSFRLAVDSDHEGETLITEIGNIEGGEDTRFLHKMKHRIVISEVAVRKRWSDVNSSDLIFLKSEMIGDVSSGRFVGSGRIFDHFTENEAMTMNIKCKFVESSTSSSIGARLVNSSEKRSMSEITNVSRLREFPCNANEERRRRLWRSITNRTMQWLARR